MELRQLAYFVAVADEGQFTRAAGRLMVAQPAVSAQIRGLETELGEILFRRGSRAVALTDAGAALLPHARAALSAADRGRDAIGSLRKVLRGRLRIGVAGPVDRALGRVLGDFHRAHPAVEVLLTTQNNEPLLEAVATGHLDVGIVGVMQPLPRQVRTHVIASEELVLAVRRDHPLAHRRTATLRQLRNEPFVTLVPGSGHREAFEMAFESAGFRPRVSAEAGELSSLVELAAEGLGAAILPRSAADGADLAVVEITRPRLLRRRALAWNEAAPSAAARAFLELAFPRLDAASPP